MWIFRADWEIWCSVCVDKALRLEHRNLKASTRQEAGLKSALSGTAMPKSSKIHVKQLQKMGWLWMAAYSTGQRATMTVPTLTDFRAAVLALGTLEVWSGRPSSLNHHRGQDRPNYIPIIIH